MNAKTMERRIFSGQRYEHLVYNVPKGVRNIRNYDPERIKKKRFKDAEEYEQHKYKIALRNYLRVFHANFSPSSRYSTLTFDNDYEVHTFREAKRIARNFLRVLKRACPDGVIFLYMGRGKSTHRIHFHMVSEGIPKEVISAKWKYGSVLRICNLREHNYYNGKDHGQDYTGLATYLFDHWTPEVGGHRWMQTKNERKPDREEPTEIQNCGYSEACPPEPLEGYILVETKSTKYGYLYFKYVVQPPKHVRWKSSAKTDPKIS